MVRKKTLFTIVITCKMNFGSLVKSTKGAHCSETVKDASLLMCKLC